MKFTLTLTQQPLVVQAPEFPTAGESGAIVDFYGVVRGQEKEASISSLHYEAYESMARKEFENIIEQLTSLYPCQEVMLTHVLGSVPVGCPSLQVRVRASHRAEAFAFAQRLIDEMKQRVPIWKRAVA